MGRPCKKQHEYLTYKNGKPKLVDKDDCTCTFPTGPVHAAYNPKMNLTEKVFAKLDEQIKKNFASDQEQVPPIVWPVKGTGKMTFWMKQLERAIAQVGQNKQYFAALYDGYLRTAQLYIKNRGERLKTSKY